MQKLVKAFYQKDGRRFVASYSAGREGKFLVINPDYDQNWGVDFNYAYHVSRNTRNKVPYGAVSGLAVPATARFTDDRFVYFVCDLQYWLHGINAGRAPGVGEERLKADFKSCFRDNAWITNYAGTFTREDCINGSNIGYGWPQIQPMSVGGAVHRLVDETRLDYLIEAINPQVNFRDYHPTTHWWLFYRPTISAREWIFDSKKNVIERREWFNEPMHFYAENMVMAVFGFIPHAGSSTGFVNRVPKYRCRILGAFESIPNPFIMRFGRSMPNPYEGY